jgi:hypothetical protein
MLKKILKWAGIGFLAFIALGIVAVATDDGKTAEKPKAAAGPSISKSVAETVGYTIADKKISGQQMDIHVVLPDRVTDKKALIEITRKLRAENNWTGKFICWFEIQIHAQSGAWANCGYLPQCESCGTDKDEDGVAVQTMIIGMSRSRADSLKELRLDTITNKELVGAFIDDAWQCKSEIYRVSGKTNKLLVGQLYGEDSHILRWMTLKTVNGERRYYFDDADIDEKDFVQIDESSRTIRFITPSGTVRQANIFL